MYAIVPPYDKSLNIPILYGIAEASPNGIKLPPLSIVTISPLETAVCSELNSILYLSVSIATANLVCSLSIAETSPKNVVAPVINAVPLSDISKKHIASFC